MPLKFSPMMSCLVVYIGMGGSYDRSYPNSANDLINNTIPSKGCIGNSSSWSSGFLNLNWINNVYITSPNL